LFTNRIEQLLIKVQFSKDFSILVHIREYVQNLLKFRDLSSLKSYANVM
jgi:hypothetical protein